MPTLVSLCRTLVGLSMGAVLAACSTFGSPALFASVDTKGLAAPQAAAVASDMSRHLAQRLAPSSTTLQFKTDGSVFGTALEASLRKAGFAIATGTEISPRETVGLGYVVDEIDGQVMARLVTPAFSLARVYQVSISGAEPHSPLSVMARELPEQK